MASIPVGGWGTQSFGAPNSSTGRVFKIEGLKELIHAMEITGAEIRPFIRNGLTEIGLFGEKKTKEYTPVEFGVLRASIGHFEPPSRANTHSLPAEASDAEKAAQASFEASHKPKPGDAKFYVNAHTGNYSVEWGTNVKYGPYIEDGFTFRERRLVFLPGVGFRYVSPFSYRGAHMFERGLSKASEAASPILSFWLKDGLTALGFDVNG